MKETQDFTNKDHSILKKELMDLSSPNQRYYICERVHVGSVPMFIFIHKKGGIVHGNQKRPNHIGQTVHSPPRHLRGTSHKMLKQKPD